MNFKRSQLSLLNYHVIPSLIVTIPWHLDSSFVPAGPIHVKQVIEVHTLSQTHSHTHIYIHTQKLTHTHIHTHTHKHIQTQTHAHIHKHTHTQIHSRHILSSSLCPSLSASPTPTSHPHGVSAIAQAVCSVSEDLVQDLIDKAVLFLWLSIPSIQNHQYLS